MRTFPTSTVQHVNASERAAWRNLAQWRVKAEIAIAILERVVEDPSVVFFSDELRSMPCGPDADGGTKLLRSENRTHAVYADQIREIFIEACQDEIVRLRKSLNDNHLLASIYGRNVPKSKGGLR